MKKLIIAGFLLASLFSASKAFAVVDYAEVIDVGTSTTPSVGNATILARDIYKTNKFKALLTYKGVGDCRHTIGDDITVSVTSGAVLRSGGYLVLGLSDMQKFKCCAGTSTTNDYGKMTIFYQIGDDDSQWVLPSELGYNE